MKTYDVIVVGSGLAGLYAASLAAQFGRVLVVTKEKLEDSNTYYAQGGIAVALAPADSPDLHYEDTIAAGAGLCDPEAVRVLVEEGPRRVADLIERGVPFDRENGDIMFTREAAHSRARILHAGGDATGANVEVTMVKAVRDTPQISVREHLFLQDLIVDDGRVSGIRVIDHESGVESEIFSRRVILATGGAGRLYAQTTNPEVTTGDGIVAAFRAGAEVADVEFVQFHPTALAVPGAPRFLISEAVRGEGGILINGAGERFASNYDPRAELAPRDVVARAILFETRRRNEPCAFLDVRHINREHFRQRFPTITKTCEAYGIDVGRQPIPVAPAVHFLMGGIRTNTWGETSIPGLYACGECACTGVHGANRLASNSLLETIVFAGRIVEHVFGTSTSSSRPNGKVHGASNAPGEYHVVITPPSGESTVTPAIDTLRDLTWAHIGIIRDADGLKHLEDTTSAWLAHWREHSDNASIDEITLKNLTVLARLMATAALYREESRGAHYRTDFPQADEKWRRRIILKCGESERRGT